MSDAQARLMAALNDVIGNQAKTYQAVVTAVYDGRVQAFSETFGNINVICRTSDKIETGTMIYVRKAGPKKFDPYIYAGYGQAPSGATTPTIDARIAMNPPLDDGSTVEEGGTLQYYLDQITTAIRAIKGTGSWSTEVAQSLSQVINWRAPVTLVGDLPSTGNRLGDIRFVTVGKTLYVWTASGWQSLDASGVAGTRMSFTTGPSGIAVSPLREIRFSGDTPTAGGLAPSAATAPAGRPHSPGSTKCHPASRAARANPAT